MTIAPVVSTATVRQSPAEAFDLFTGRMGEWWPGKTVGARPAVAILIEPRPNGRWFERDCEGAETQWGIVLHWDPPFKIVLGWQLDSSFNYDPAILTEVEITFTALDGGGTEVRLEHRKLERFGAEADRVAGLVGPGWARILTGFAQHAAAHLDLGAMP